MSKHFVKPYFVAVAGAVMGLMFMALEARGAPLTLQHEAECYAMAAMSDLDFEAKVHRINLRQYEADRADISYYIGYRIGFIVASADSFGLAPSVLADAMYKEQCQVEM